MKHFKITHLLFIIFLCSCGSSTKITASWVNKEAIPTQPFKSIYIIALTTDLAAKFVVETKVEALLTKRGRKSVRSEFMTTPTVSPDKSISKEHMEEVVKESGCDAVFTISLLDVKTEEHYVEGKTYAPNGYGFSGTYYGYYDHYSQQVSTPGYYETNKTYYVESNFYDAVSNKLLWSIQSTTYDPHDLDAWFKAYSRSMMKELKKQGLLVHMH